MDTAKSIVEKRVNALGSSEATVQLQGTNSILVQIPGATNADETVSTIGQTGHLEFVKLEDIGDAEALAKISAGTDNVPLQEGTYTAFMRQAARPGIAALAATAGQDISQVRSDSLPFSIIPRLNAAGRMGTTDVAFDLLLTEDPAEAAMLAGRLEEINNERREIEASLSEEAMALAEASYDGGRVIVVGGEGWHEGVKGIVASRLVNHFHARSRGVRALLGMGALGVGR